MREHVEKYFDHLNKIFKVEPSYFKHSKNKEHPPFYSLTYKNIPSIGMVTGITCGISVAARSARNGLGIELMISVDTEDDIWVLALSDIGLQRRGQFFHVGETINFGEKISQESEMTSFLVWHQNIIKENYETVCFKDTHIKILQLFPIHDDERQLIQKHGPEWLFKLVNDPFDVRRKSVAYRFIDQSEY